MYTEIINCLILCLAPPNINSWLRYYLKVIIMPNSYFLFSTNG